MGIDWIKGRVGLTKLTDHVRKEKLPSGAQLNEIKRNKKKAGA